jgi:hypothetical protein
MVSGEYGHATIDEVGLRSKSLVIRQLFEVKK